VALLEESILARHHKAAEMLLSRLTCVAGHAITINRQTCVGRHLGAAAAMLGRPDEARGYYDQEMKMAPSLERATNLAAGLSAERGLSMYSFERQR
jgi:hypothetical protein